MSRCRRDALAAELTGRNGREGGTRTRDLLYPKQVALLLAHSPWSGRSDLSRRSPASKTGALARLSYAQGGPVMEFEPMPLSLGGRALIHQHTGSKTGQGGELESAVSGLPDRRFRH